MYENMLRDVVITNAKKPLSKKFIRVHNYLINKIIKALIFSLDNNIFVFGDTFW